MKRSIISQFNQLQEKYTSQVSMLNFYYLNLCIKAEEAALLPVKVQVDGAVMDLEKAATIAKKNDYEFMVIPNYEDDLKPVAEGIANVHPEFKQKVENLTLEATEEGEEEQEVPYILLTMPEVDDDRHDFLKKTADALYDDCKLRMEEALAKTTAELTPLLADQTEQDKDKVKQAIDQLNKERNSQRDEMHEQKLKEIKEAYKKWLGAFGQQAIANMEDEDAHGNAAAMSMTLE
ncbi:MAG: ribosome recycling factor [Prevotella sp.]|nr:ribosome recycling factor [Prevotella sp.]